MESREIRQSFLDFFAGHGHRIVPSSSLIPAGDETLLFTNAGMNQFKDVFLGLASRDYRRAATAQKCMRVSGKHNDLANVGPSLRHHTFFEMLGNFSFGDYFKREAIPFAWTLLTERWGLPADRLSVSIFAGEAGVPRDDDAHAIWRGLVPEDRIIELGLADNFWQMGDTGPCGRCSEIHYFRGAEHPCPRDVCLGVGCDCDRFVEIWNNVFMEFDRQPDGTLLPLPAPSIDTGMGLERITAVMQGTLSNYDTDLFGPLLDAIGQIAGVRYVGGTNAGRADDVHLRVIADHTRAMTFLIADGVVPSNEWRGYVLRKIMRRAMRHGKQLGIAEPFLHRLVPAVVSQMGEPYPDLPGAAERLVRMVRDEESRFDAVLTAGLPRLDALLARAARTGSALGGEEAFRLYDTFGVPLDFIEDTAEAHGVAFDRAGFEAAMAAQRRRGREASTFTSTADQLAIASDETRTALAGAADGFVGYETTAVAGASVLAVFDEALREVPALEAGQRGYVALDPTPFYLQSGGQVSDTGRLSGNANRMTADVAGVVKPGPQLPRLHEVRVTAGTLRRRDVVGAEVAGERRDGIRRHHTATHLLHAALRQVLGSHVSQQGSLVAPDRLRFDFVHFAPLTDAQIQEIELVVNERIWQNLPVVTEVQERDAAIAAGAMALFGEKYGDRVRVVSVLGFSVELCGGTHCRATGEIGVFTIVGEGGVAAGVRRLEAMTGRPALAHLQALRGIVERAAGVLHAPQERVADAIERLQQESRLLAREVADLKVKRAVAKGPEDQAIQEVDGVQLIARRVEDADRQVLRSVADSLKAGLRSGVVVLAAEHHGKVSLVVSVTPDLTKRAPAGQIVKSLAALVGGGGGGRADFAEAGGKDPSKIDDMLGESRSTLARLLAETT